MKRFLVVPMMLLACGGGASAPAAQPTPKVTQAEAEPPRKAIESEVIKPREGELILVQRVHLKVPPSRAWEAYTTEEGWRAWVAPVVSLDFRTGGVIQSHYKPGAKIGDPGTIRLHIKNYVPETLITLQAELGKNFPEFMGQDETRLYNVITFEAVPGGTLLVSYGLGYRDTEPYRKLLEQFVSFNEQSFAKLKKWVEG